MILPVSDIEAAASFSAPLLKMPGTRVASRRHYFDCGLLRRLATLFTGEHTWAGTPHTTYPGRDSLSPRPTIHRNRELRTTRSSFQ